MTSLLEVALAGLLHDIGKFAQRARRGEEGICDTARSLKDYLCPVETGRYTHLHSVFTADFILTQLGSFLPEGMDRERVLHMAAYHHRPDSPEDHWITEADRLSSGMEREEDESAPSIAGAFRRVRLRAIANEVGLGEQAPGKWSVELAPLEPLKAFPFLEQEPPSDLTDAYSCLWEAFVAAWSQNCVADPWAFVNRAASVLEKYTWCIPAATNVYPDISLFDHLKTTAAIAVCLASTEQDDTEPFLLATGDFGGIQRYLFDIQMGAGGLARRLRARSLSVSLAVENTVHWILHQLGIPLTNCLQSAGGRFVLLLPNTPRAREKVQEAQRMLDQWAAEQVGCELQPHIAMLPISRAALSDFGTVVQRLWVELEKSKATPLAGFLTDADGWREQEFVLPPLPVAETGGLCSSCRRQAGHLRPMRDRQVPLCDRCFQDAETGAALVRGRFVAFWFDDSGRLPFGNFRILETEEQVPQNAYLALDLSGNCGRLPHTPVVGRYIARHVPRDEDGSIMEFSEIAERSKGRKALAFLKADVDNLGLILTSGLQGEEKDRRSISRITALSRTLELFFGGYVEHLAAEIGTIYTVYSGGDDLLLVGPWDSIIECALRLRKDFRCYTCGNKSWSLSAGIALVHPKTPVLWAVEEADARLEGAKDSRHEDATPWPMPGGGNGAKPPTKDKLVLFGTVLPWDAAEDAAEKAGRLLDWMEQGQVSTAQARRLLHYASLFQQWQRTGDVLNFRFAPLLAYDIRRNWKEAPGEALSWVQALAMPNSADMPLLRLICEYALNGARSDRGGEDNSEAGR
ncbi:MAG: type III-A CRISPR-associated protein Cas10/Csm1 [Armatimonadetes bacterium]|nr:type III-A CRISPR-associated protein Cas10/Csm1 [Armatimonadota bacterium]